MKRALILVDVQNDFLPGGALAVSDGNEIIPVINRLLASGLFDVVVATQDWHPESHKSFASQHEARKPGDQVMLNGLPQVLWPNHCVEDTHGAAISKAVNQEHIHHVVYKGIELQVDSYSGFFDNDRRNSTGLEDILHRQVVTDVYVTGLATDYCVKFTALDAVSLGFTTYLIQDACRGVNLKPEDVSNALAEMREKNIHIISSDSLLRK